MAALHHTGALTQHSTRHKLLAPTENIKMHNLLYERRKQLKSRKEMITSEVAISPQHLKY